mmetsp:Transcript_21138/g.51006  ORF Transcript_21138/g.51006 Transcript_21138/m.51006 type:complete len:87 (-) Transcript_21138:55-315(-)
MFATIRSFQTLVGTACDGATFKDSDFFFGNRDAENKLAAAGVNVDSMGGIVPGDPLHFNDHCVAPADHKSPFSQMFPDGVMPGTGI